MYLLHQGNRNKTWFSPQDMQGCNRERKENCRTWVLQCCKSFGLPGSGCSLPIQHGQAYHHWCRQSGPHHWPVLYPRHQPRLGRKQKAQHDEQVSSQKHDRTILNVKIYVIVCYCYIILYIILYIIFYNRPYWPIHPSPAMVPLSRSLGTVSMPSRSWSASTTPPWASPKRHST